MPGIEDTATSAPGEGIQVVVDDELIVSDRSTSPRMRSAAPMPPPLPEDDEDTEVKAAAQRARASERPSRNPSPRR